MVEKEEKTQDPEEEMPAEEAEVEEEVEVEEKEAEVKDEEETFEGEEIEEEVVPRRKEEEETFVEERIYKIPLRRAWIMPANKRAPRAIRILKAFIRRHMKIDQTTGEREGEEEEGGRLIISNEVNERIWSRGIEKPPRKLRVRAAKDEEGNVTVFLA